MVDHSVVKATQTYFEAFTKTGNIQSVWDVPGEHAQLTDAFGNPCMQGPTHAHEIYLNDCNYDAAGAGLQWLYGNTLTAPPSPTSLYNGTGHLMPFNQQMYTLAGPWSTAFGLDDTGYVYVPTNCAPDSPAVLAGNTCKLHVTLHGCLMNYKHIGLDYVQHSGHVAWADANDIVLLFPQTIASGINEKACFDWFGYTGTAYSSNVGVQPMFVKATLDAMMS